MALKRAFTIIVAVVFALGIITGVQFSALEKTAYAEGPCDYDFYMESVLRGIDPCDTACSVGSTSAAEEEDDRRMKNEEETWNFFYSRGLSDIAIAGIMGNFAEESKFDPAVKQDQSLEAIPAEGDGVTGFGLAQWTSKGRQAGLFTMVKAAGLEEYYGEGWGGWEINKEIPVADMKELLQVELEYAWSSDSPSISSMADELNKAEIVEGNDGSTVLFHNTFEVSSDTAAEIQERVAAAKVYLAKYAGTCAAGLGGVATIEDAIPWAQRFVADTQKAYPNADGRELDPNSQGSANFKPVYDFDNDDGMSGGDGYWCWGGSDCGQCTALSGWFVTNMTEYRYNAGNGGDVVFNLSGMEKGSDPRPFSVFSIKDGGPGHTGVVLGVLESGEIITIEDNMGLTDEDGGVVAAKKYSSVGALTSAFGYSIEFAYVGDKLKGDAAGLGAN